MTSGARYIPDLKEDIARALKLDVRTSAITLHIATVDESTGTVLQVAAAALPSRKALADIIELRSGASIVVKVAGGPSTEPRLDSSAGLREAQTMWRGLLATSFTVNDVQKTAAVMSACALSDMALTVEKQAQLWQSPVAKILQQPIPYDTSSEDGPVAMLELLQPATSSTSKEPLFKQVWAKLEMSLDSTVQRKRMVMLTGASGAGKSKVAFDIGREYAFVVLARVWEGGILTPPWETLSNVITKLQAQSIRHPSASPLAVSERVSAVASMLLLLSCHLEWALMVYKSACAPSVLTGSSPDVRMLREAILRAQRNGTGQRNVDIMFRRRLLEAVEGNFGTDGCMAVPIDVALNRFRQLRSDLPPAVPVVWCYDEVQALLNNGPFDRFFESAFVAADFEDVGAAAPTDAPPVSSVLSIATLDRGASFSATYQPTLRALAADVSACNAEIHKSGSRGWFYGLLVAVRHLMREFRWGHLLCGSSLRLNRELLQAHSPAQGVAVSMDADMRFDVHTLRSWLGNYLTPDAAYGLNDALLSKLAGRPMFSSFVFAELHRTLSRPTPELLAATPSAVVTAAVERAVISALEDARTRVDELWGRKFPTAAGLQPQRLVAWLFYLQRMGFGLTTTITPPSMSAEVMDAVQRGVLHIGRDAVSINLQDEPITAEAILAEGDKRTAAAGSFAEDSVLSALARRVSGEFGDDSNKGTTAEEVIAWTLLRRARSGPISLRALLTDFLGPDQLGLFPESLLDHTAHLDRGLACSLALGPDAAGRTFLELLAQPGGEKLLLHQTQQSAAGADLAFIAQRPGLTAGSKPRQRLILIQVKNAASATLTSMLRSVDLGKWYPDMIRPASLKSETRSHAALRRMLADHPDWADPVRVLVSARPWAEDTKLTAAWINMAKVPAQPILLAQLSEASIGLSVGQSRASSQVNPPNDALCWWPTRVRHWPDLSTHPQSSLPLAPTTALAVLPSHHVRFSVGGTVPVGELEAAVTTARGYRVVCTADASLELRFDLLWDAMRAVADAEAGTLKVCDTLVTAEFVRQQQT